MCLAIPGRVVEIEGTTAKVDFGGVTRDADVTFVPDASRGDYVLVHAGFAIERLDEAEALETFKLFRELAQALDHERGGESR
jgi:hydrogenase expression/formation protein HypC